MRSRSECIEILDYVADFSDDEVTMNRDLIREVASEAAGHLKQAAQIKNENRRLREKIRNKRKEARA